MEGQIARKPRSGFIRKFVLKLKNKFITYSLPFLRYSIMPAAFYYALNYTEPAVSFLEIVNPFW